MVPVRDESAPVEHVPGSDRPSVEPEPAGLGAEVGEDELLRFDACHRAPDDRSPGNPITQNAGEPIARAHFKLIITEGTRRVAGAKCGMLVESARMCRWLNLGV